MKTDSSGDLLFQWRSQHRIHILFPFMVIVSFGLHLASLVIFQIIYPEPSPGAYRPASITAVLQSTPRADAFYAWLDASDPALFSQYQPDKRELFQLPEISFQPSFDTHRPDINVPEAQIPRILPPEQIFDFLADTESNFIRHPKTGVIAKSPPVTKVIGTGPLADKAWPQPDTASIQYTLNEFPAPSVFDVAFSPENNIRYLLLQKSSGNEHLDQLARQTLLKMNIEKDTSDSATSSDLTWGSVWFLWGPDVFPNTPPPSS
ncbi:MAG: hypothetical protein ACK5LK_10260 [Chthoniobacterales bacterium]